MLKKQFFTVLIMFYNTQSQILHFVSVSITQIQTRKECEGKRFKHRSWLNLELIAH